MDVIKIKDKDFAVSIPESKILCEVERLAAQISRDLEGKNPCSTSIHRYSYR